MKKKIINKKKRELKVIYKLLVENKFIHCIYTCKPKVLTIIYRSPQLYTSIPINKYMHISFTLGYICTKQSESVPSAMKELNKLTYNGVAIL